MVASSGLSASSSAIRFPQNLPAGWRMRLESELHEDYFKNLKAFLNQEESLNKEIFPPKALRMRALQLTDFDQVKVVILGQDPYHGPGQAIGLSFAVPNGFVPKPPSLLNIFKEAQTDLNFQWDKKSSELTGWAKQGVLLLNTILSVERSKPLSHQNRGWETFTDKVIQHLNQAPQKIVFILWGASAQKKKFLIDETRHCIFSSAHPSPLSAHRGFFGSKVFSKTNQTLIRWGEPAIDWKKINE
ncbi:MAG: uracil-DNA glycosylase [Bdellovibrionota bacterium]